MTNQITYKTEIIKASEVKPNDTLIIDGEMQTISSKFIKNGFCGIVINGVNMRNGAERVLFPKFFKGQLLGYFAQI